MRLVEFSMDYYEDVVDMFYDFNIELFSKYRKIGYKYFYYKAVMNWINDKKHIIICIDKYNNPIGFSLAYIDDNSGLTERYYNGEIAYVKPAYRKGKASYLLYKNVVAMSVQLGLNLNSNGRIENGIDKMIEKHFNPIPLFTNYERIL